jgi:integron integrase
MLDTFVHGALASAPVRCRMDMNSTRLGLRRTEGVPLEALTPPPWLPWGDLKAASPGAGSAGEMVRRVRQAIRRRHYSLRTEKAYLGWLRRFLAFHGDRDAPLMGAAEVRAYLTHLAVRGRVSASTQNQAFSALLFFFHEVLERKLDGLADIPRAKGPVRLPVVLTRSEVRAVLSRLRGRVWLIASLMYGSGLRLHECLALRVKDVEFGRRVLVIRDGKGRKDRETVLPGTLLDPLRQHLQRVRIRHDRDSESGCGAVTLPDALERKYPRAAWELGWQWVFPAVRQYVDDQTGTLRRHHLHPTMVQRLFRTAVRAAGISKPATSHSLRHYPERRIIPTWPRCSARKRAISSSGLLRTRDNPGPVSSARHGAGQGGDACWKTSSHLLPRSDCGPASSAATSTRSARSSSTSATSARRFGTSFGSSAI